MFWYKTPAIIQKLFPKMIWRKKSTQPRIYLTFDDGPIPQATPMVLRHLADFQARATFFCVGENIEKHPAIFDEVLAQGHAVGNHTQNHLNGWQVDLDNYLDNVKRCQQIINERTGNNLPPLFRPPYGRLSYNQVSSIIEHYQIVMWDVLSGDFSEAVSAEKCLKKSLQHTSSGSIIVFHDSLKTMDKLDQVLPKFLDHFSRKGFSFESLQG